MARFLEYWLLLPRWLMFCTLAGGFITTACLIFTLSHNRWIRDHVLKYHGVVPPYVNVLAVLLALLTGFVASDTWERQKHARQVIQSESDNVLAIYDLSIAAKSDLSRIRDALRKYVGAVITDEWPRMRSGGKSAEAGDALGLLMMRISTPKVATDAGTTVQAALLRSTMKVRSDRGERLSLNAHGGDHTKWLVLLILGFLTQCAIGVVHLDRARAQIVALGIFTTGLISTVGLIAEHEWPFDGKWAIQPTALYDANDRIWGGGIEFTGPRGPDEDVPGETMRPGSEAEADAGKPAQQQSQERKPSEP